MDQSNNKVLSRGFYKNLKSRSVHGDPGGCPLCHHVIVLVPLNFIGVTCRHSGLTCFQSVPLSCFALSQMTELYNH